MMVLCDRCGGATPRTTPTYWGPELCPRCCRETADLNDLLDKWPPTPWPDNESEAA